MKNLVSLVVISFLLVIPGLVLAHTADNPFRTDLIAGGGSKHKGTDVGDVLVWNDSDNLYVEYVVDAPGWKLIKTHLDVELSMEDIPQRHGNPVPGQFFYSEDKGNAVALGYYEIPIPGVQVGTRLYIAAHAEVQGKNGALLRLLARFRFPRGKVGLTVSYPVDSNGTPLSMSATLTKKLGKHTRPLGTYECYCIDPDDLIVPGDEYAARLYSSYGIAGRRFVKFPENLDLANYVLNNYSIGSEYSFVDIQGAITHLLAGGDCPDGSKISEIVTDALDNGEGFVPSCGGVFGVIIVPRNRDHSLAQVLIASFPLNCHFHCSGGEETAWGKGCDFPGRNWAMYFTYTVQASTTPGGDE